MKLLLTMAGLGSRFKDAGFDQEKYAISFRGHRLIEWSLASLTQFRDYELILITRDVPGIESDLVQVAKNLGFAHVRVKAIDRLTRGQAETALAATEFFDQDESILIFNTDTFIDPSVLSPNDIRGDGWIPTFQAVGDKWSFVEADESGMALRTTEKHRISDDCSVGLYYFSSFFGFKRIVEEAETDRELYVAPFYNQWIDEGHPTYLHRLPTSSVTVLGTPEDLEMAAERENLHWPETCRIRLASDSTGNLGELSATLLSSDY